MKEKLADFDDYVEEYEELLKSQLSFFNSERDYFSLYKVQYLAKNLNFKPKKILDFGCGIGLSLPHFLSHFPHSKVCATDISKKSLSYVEKHFPQVKTLENSALEGESFDLIFLSGVMHHIPPTERLNVIKQIKPLLSPKGVLAIFEHNPYNPVTRMMVANCPFDKGVELLTMRELERVMKDGEIAPLKKAYTLFFPQFLNKMRPFEKNLSWLPLGGQYVVIGALQKGLIHN